MSASKSSVETNKPRFPPKSGTYSKVKLIPCVGYFANRDGSSRWRHYIRNSPKLELTDMVKTCSFEKHRLLWHCLEYLDYVRDGKKER